MAVGKLKKAAIFVCLWLPFFPSFFCFVVDFRATYPTTYIPIVYFLYVLSRIIVISGVICVCVVAPGWSGLVDVAGVRVSCAN